MQLLGIDVGSSSVKTSIIDAATGECLASVFYPKQEMNIIAEKTGWAEQKPQDWWSNMKLALADCLKEDKVDAQQIKAIGISYQMHGLVMVDKDQKVLRPSIIWCDSRATEVGAKAFDEIGGDKCLNSLLNSPGNFTASKLKWVKDNEPEIFEQCDKIMLPGDYMAMRLTGEVTTTASGLSEGIFWDFQKNEVSQDILANYGFDASVIPTIVDTFANQGQITKEMAAELGISEEAVVAYRGGDQPNNALSLNVLKPGEVATTAGTSGVVYGVSGDVKYDPKSRVNTFAHVNHSAEENRLGVLLCINGTGILNSWMNSNVGGKQYSYPEMNELASQVPIGSDGLVVLPFGNGAERVLQNQEVGAQVSNLSFNIHSQGHMFRAAQEGIVFSFKYGMDIMKEVGIETNVIRAGEANMFLSPIFRETLAGITGATIELYNTDGSVGAARGAGVGCGFYPSFDEAFKNLKVVKTITPKAEDKAAYEAAYAKWLKELEAKQA